MTIKPRPIPADLEKFIRVHDLKNDLQEAPEVLLQWDRKNNPILTTIRK